MIQFTFTGEPYPSLEEQEKSKNNFTEKLGVLKVEFEQKGGYAVFDYSFPETDTCRCAFGFNNDTNLADFINRWQMLTKEQEERKQHQ